MNVIVVGGGHVGSRLARLLLTAGNSVKVIERGGDGPQDRHSSHAQGLPPDVLVVGSGTDPAVLEAAGAGHADLVAAVTGSDEANLVVASLARVEFEVPQVVARVNDPENAWMFTPAMGVDVALDQADLLVRTALDRVGAGHTHS